MKLSTLAAAAVIGAAFTLMAPGANAMPRLAEQPINLSQTGDVQIVHGRHCRIRRGHRSRCRRARRGRHLHRHCHRRFCHRHRHYRGHHRGRFHGGGRPRFGIYFGF